MPHNPTLAADEIRACEGDFVLAQVDWQPSIKRKDRRLGRVSLFLIAAMLIAIGLAFRIWRLNHVPGLNGDEAWSGVQALKFLHGEPVAWRTPTGNPLNVFFCAPLVLLHALFPPSIGLLRTVSVASAVLALAVNYYLCRRVFDATTALTSTTFLAVLPINIAYSRFAWDASQSLLATTVVMYLALDAVRKHRGVAYGVGVAIAFVAAVVVHPTNVFIAPIVGVCFWRSFNAASMRIANLPSKRWILVATAAFGLVLGFLLWPWVPAVLGRAFSLGEICQFLANFRGLLSGASVYQFISGGPDSSSLLVIDMITWLVAILAIKGLVVRIRSGEGTLDACLAQGLAISLVGFYLIAGPRGVMPHFERYAIWTVAPMTLLVTRGWTNWMRYALRYRLPAISTAICVSLLLLVCFYTNYFRVFAKTGGESHLAFHTAIVDPKQAAFQTILRADESANPVVIVSENWWTRLPLEYFAFDSVRRVTVLTPEEFAVIPARDLSHTWFVELAGSDDEFAAAKSLERDGYQVERSEETDSAGRPVVVILHAVEKSTESLKNFPASQFDKLRS